MLREWPEYCVSCPEGIANVARLSGVPIDHLLRVLWLEASPEECRTALNAIAPFAFGGGADT